MSVGAKEPCVVATSSAASPSDDVRRDLVRALLQEQGKSLSEYGKHVASLSFAAIAVTLTMSKDWFGPALSNGIRITLGLAILCFVLAAAAGTIGAAAQEHQVSLDDYWDVEAELQRVAKFRFGAVSVALFLSCFGIGIIALAALS